MAKKARRRKPRTKAVAKQGRRRRRKPRRSSKLKKSCAKKATATACRSRRRKPWGQAGKALDGVQILDFTHVQSGPTCTQLLGLLGADVIKVERPGRRRHHARPAARREGRRQPLFHHAQRQQALDHASTPSIPKGKEILERLIKHCDVLVENFAPGALDRMGLTWEHIHKLNPRMIVASVKGFGPGPYEDCKVYENVAQCAGGSASTTGFRDGPPLVTGAQIGDSRHRPASRARHRARRSTSATAPAAARRCSCAMQDGVLNLCARQAARPAAPRARPAHRIQPVRRGHPVRQGGAARRQRFRRRPARLDPEVQGLGDRSRRLHLFHHPGAGVGARSAT